jgi:rod shape-determining protein MreC
MVYPKTWYENILYIKSNNGLLVQNITQLKLLNSKLTNYQRENIKLREMLNFKESYPKLSLLPANKVNDNFTSIFSIIINVGLNDDIFKNQPVIDMNGLVGKTITIGSNASKVQLITDKNFAVSVKVGEEMTLAIFKPTFGKYGYLEGVLKTLELEEGEIIYTSGVSEIYPSDIPVAKIVSFTKDKDKLTQNVIVELLAKINELNYVFVIK